MKFLLALVVLLPLAPLEAAQRPAILQRTNLMQASRNSGDDDDSAAHAWKIGLLGLAALSFLIRRRL